MPITPKPVVASEVLSRHVARKSIEFLDGYCCQLGGAAIGGMA